MRLLDPAHAGSALFPEPANHKLCSLLVMMEIHNHVTKIMANRGDCLHNVYGNIFKHNLTFASQTLDLGLTLYIAVARVGQDLQQLGLYLGLLAFTAGTTAHIRSHFTSFL